MHTARPYHSSRAILALAFGAAVHAATPFAMAQTAPAPAGVVESGNVPEPVEEPPPVNRGRVTFSVGSDITTAYFFRGILQERDGFILQPYGGVALKVYEGDDESFVDNVTINVASWNSVQSNKTLASGSGPTNWYESDFIFGPSITFADYFTASLLYIAYTFPNGAFPTVQELAGSLSINDSEWLGAFALQPSMTWAGEMDNTAFGDRRGVYLQLGVKPSTVLFDEATYPLTLALPLTLGLSVHDYYEVPGVSNDTFGFFDAGLVGSVPLAFIPEEFGAWSASVGVDVLALSGTLANANKGNGTWWIGKMGFAMAY